MTERTRRVRAARSAVQRTVLVPSAALLLMLIVIWAATGAGYFWPMWAASDSRSRPGFG